MRTNFRSSVLAATMLVGCAALGVVGCGKPGNSEPSFRLNGQNQDPDDYRLVGTEDEAGRNIKEFNSRSREYVIDALEAMFGTPDRPYVFPESGLDLAKVFQAAGPVGGLPQSEINKQVMAFREAELKERAKIEDLTKATKAAETELAKQQTTAKPDLDRLTAAKTALAEAEKAKNEPAIAEQKKQIETIQAALKPYEATQAVKTEADAKLAAVDATIKDLMRQIDIWQNSAQLGLYRQHCSHCHGTTGDGAGPTALFLTPFPRDYRQGIFKYKSTERAAKPTHADLRRILVDGIPDSAMPTVALLKSDEIDALVEYVKYLSMRGEAETALRATWMEDRQEMRPNRAELITIALQPLADVWKEAADQVVKPGETYQKAYDAWKANAEKVAAEEAAKAGRTAKTAVGKDDWLKEASILFGGQKGQCYTCHGTTGLGDGRKRSEPLFDDWNKPKKFTQTRDQIAAAKEADKDDEVRRLTNILHSWQLPEQQQFPRNLRLGRFRFGRAPLDIYRRIHAGIAGTEMPGGGPPAPGQQAKLTPTEIWQLVDYVLLLPYLDPTGRMAPSGEHAPAAHHASNAAPPGPAEGQ